MTTYNTRNPVPSVDVRDLYDNAENLDNFSNAAGDFATDRLGVSRQTLQGIRNASQYQSLGAYAAGLEFTSYNQTFSYLGEFYAPSAGVVLPYTTTGVGAAEIATFRSVGDATLRADLADSIDQLKGAGQVGFDDDLAYASNTVGGYLHERKTGISVVQLGADPTGVADSTTEIQAAIDAAAAANTFVYGDGEFRLTGKVVIKCGCDFSQADFMFYGQPAIGLELSTGSAANPTDPVFGLTFKLPRNIVNVDKPAMGWAGAGVGVRTVNLNSCFVELGTIFGFDTGLLSTSYGASSGHSYTTFLLKTLDTNRINLDLNPGDTLGWVNENLYIAGRYRFNSSEGTNVPGTRHIRINKATNSCNNNLFIKPSVEGNTPEYHVENGGSYNTLQQARWEAATPKVLYTGTTAQQGTDNIILGGYQSANIVFTYNISGSATGNYNQVIGSRQQLETTGFGKISMNVAGDDAPVWRIQQAASRPEAATATNYAVKQSAQTHRGKLAADTFDRVLINYNTPRITFGGGSATQDVGLIRTSANSLQLLSGVAVFPSLDNAVSFGIASLRWSVIYAGTGTINTSDGRQKQQIRELSEKERATAVRLKKLIRAYKFNDAVASKGDDARTHFGVIAQDVVAAFADEGLDATKYAIICHDEWEAQPAQLDEEGAVLTPEVLAGDRYGIRYDELLAFILGAI